MIFRLQELFLKLSFSIANADDDSPLPDVVGTITNATSCPAARQARKEIAELGEFVTNAATAAPAFEQGIIAYTRLVCELDVKFLEQIRDEICEGYDAFMRVAEVVKQYPHKESQVRYHLGLSYCPIADRVSRRCTKLLLSSCHTLSASRNV